jgi:hypothetical protein
MFGIPWYVTVFESIPEAFLIIIIGFSLFNIQFTMRDAVIMAVLSAVTTHFIRQAPIIFGLHSLFAIVILIVLAVLINRTQIWPATLAILGGVVILAILQSLMVPIIFKLASIQLSDLSVNPWLNVIFFIPQALVMIGIYVVLRCKNWYLYDLGQKR